MRLPGARSSCRAALSRRPGRPCADVRSVDLRTKVGKGNALARAPPASVRLEDKARSSRQRNPGLTSIHGQDQGELGCVGERVLAPLDSCQSWGDVAAGKSGRPVERVENTLRC